MSEMRAVRRLLLDLFGPTSRFEIGQGVQRIDGDELMVVIEIVNRPGLDEPHIRCQWFDSQEKVSKKQFFSENELKVFDWYRHEGQVQPKS